MRNSAVGAPLLAYDTAMISAHRYSKIFTYVGTIRVSGNTMLPSHIDTDVGDRADLRKFDLDTAVTWVGARNHFSDFEVFHSVHCHILDVYYMRVHGISNIWQITEWNIQCMTNHGMEYFKITYAQQTGLINYYKNTNYKLLKTKAAAWFNNKSHIWRDVILVNLSAVNAWSTRHIFGWHLEYVDKSIYVLPDLRSNKVLSPPSTSVWIVF